MRSLKFYATPDNDELASLIPPTYKRQDTTSAKARAKKAEREKELPLKVSALLEKHSSYLYLWDERLYRWGNTLQGLQYYHEFESLTFLWPSCVCGALVSFLLQCSTQHFIHSSSNTAFSLILCIGLFYCIGVLSACFVQQARSAKKSSIYAFVFALVTSFALIHAPKGLPFTSFDFSSAVDEFAQRRIEISRVIETMSKKKGTSNFDSGEKIVHVLSTASLFVRLTVATLCAVFSGITLRPALHFAQTYLAAIYGQRTLTKEKTLSKFTTLEYFLIHVGYFAPALIALSFIPDDDEKKWQQYRVVFIISLVFVQLHPLVARVHFQSHLLMTNSRDVCNGIAAGMLLQRENMEKAALIESRGDHKKKPKKRNFASVTKNCVEEKRVQAVKALVPSTYRAFYHTASVGVMYLAPIVTCLLLCLLLQRMTLPANEICNQESNSMLENQNRTETVSNFFASATGRSDEEAIMIRETAQNIAKSFHFSTSFFKTILGFFLFWTSTSWTVCSVVGILYYWNRYCKIQQ
eukprot:g2701.t1